VSRPWQRYFLKIPRLVKKKVASINGPLVVGVAKQIPVEVIADGLYAHLGIVLDPDTEKVVYLNTSYRPRRVFGKRKV